MNTARKGTKKKIMLTLAKSDDATKLKECYDNFHFHHDNIKPVLLTIQDIYKDEQHEHFTVPFQQAVEAIQKAESTVVGTKKVLAMMIVIEAEFGLCDDDEETTRQQRVEHEKRIELFCVSLPDGYQKIRMGWEI